MATRLRTNATQGSDKFWLSSEPSREGVHVQTWTHDERWPQIDVCDYDAPPERRWRVTIIDRQTHAAGRCDGAGGAKDVRRRSSDRGHGASSGVQRTAHRRLSAFPSPGVVGDLDIAVECSEVFL